MLIIVDVEDKSKKCESCNSKGELIEIRALDTKVNIYSSIRLCEKCRLDLLDKLLPF